MKKTMILMLAGLMAMSLISCSENNSSTADSADITTTVATTTETSAAEDETSSTESADSNSEAAEGTPLATLNKIWASYQEDEKFAVIGGDFSEENNNPEGPGKYDLADAEAVDASLGMPQTAVAKLDDAASMVHMMNANTFTSSAYLVKDGEDVAAIAEELHTNIMNRHWMCGFPDKLVIFTIDNQIVSAFGALDPIDKFKEKVIAAYPDAVLTVESDIVTA